MTEMVAQVVASHSILVKVFLVFLAAGFLIPFTTRQNPLGFKKASFVYTMVFQALASMIAFTGIISLVMGEFGMTLSIIVMIVIWALLMYIEIKKYKLIKVASIDNEEIHALLKGAFLKISAVQVMLVVMMIVLKVMEVKGVISLS